MSTYRFRSEKFLSRKFKDLAISFDDNPNTNDFATVTNENAIKQSVRNLILTTFGERPFQPNLGSRVKGLLFEPFDVFLAEDLKAENVDVQLSEDENSIDVALEYNIVGQPQTQVVEFLLERT